MTLIDILTAMDEYVKVAVLIKVCGVWFRTSKAYFSDYYMGKEFDDLLDREIETIRAKDDVVEIYLK